MLYPDESYRLLGACFEVHRDKGCGFLEPVYQEWLEIELAFQHIPFIARSGLILTYRGRQLRRTYRPDFLCHGKIIIEIKAVAAIIDAHRAQLINYLHATGYHLGLFG
jgi:GxxExxY protein